MGFGIYALVAKDSIASVIPPDIPIKAAISILIFVGGVVFVSGFFGCCGAIKENRCMLMTFFLVILIVFIFEIVAVVLMYVYYPKVQAEVIKIMTTTDDFQYIEKELHCCGYNGPQDYTNSSSSKIPDSCIESTDGSGKRKYYQTGCKNVLFTNFWYIGGIGIFILFVELLAMISAICLYQGVGSGYEEA